MPVRIPRLRPLLAAAAALGLAATLAWALVDRWEPYPEGTPGGPWGGSVRRLVSLDAEGTTLVAATGGGLYRSADGGDTWAPCNAGLQSLDVTDVAVCDGTPSRLLATTYLGGVHASTDGGLTWARVGEGTLPGDPLWRVAVDPVDPDRCYVATNVDRNPELLASADGGATWDTVGVYSVTRMRFASDRTLYFSTRGGRIYTVPLGATQPGQPMAPAGSGNSTPIADFALPGGAGQKIAVAQEGYGLVVSEDGGATWAERFYSTIAGGNDFTYVDAVASDPLDARRILFHVNDPSGSAGAARATALWESADLGATRGKLDLPEKGMELAADPGGGLFVTRRAEWILENKAGVFRRDGRAGPFAHQSWGMAAFDARDLDWGPDGALAVAGGKGFTEPGNAGLYVWDPGAGDWLRRARTYAATPSIDAGSTNIVRYKGSILWACQDGLGVFRSGDAGATWEDVSGGIGFGADDAFYGLAFSHNGSPDALLGTQQGVHRHPRRDGGPGWEVLQPAQGPAQIRAWRIAPDVRSVKGFFAAAANGSGEFWVTADAGDTWAEATSFGFPAGEPAVALAASGQVGGHALVATRFSGLWETLDGGLTWAERSGEGLPRGEAIAVALGGEGDAYMAVSIRGHGVYLSGDAGASWKRVLDGLSAAPSPGGDPHPLLANALAFEPGTARLVAAVVGGGLRYLDAEADTRPPVGFAEPPGDTYPQPVKVKLGADERLARVHFTLDDTEPTEASPLYEAPFLLTSPVPTVVRYLPVDPAGNRGDAGAATYVISTSTDRIPRIVASPRGGTFRDFVDVTLTPDEPMESIYYTLDGTSPVQGDGRTPSVSALAYGIETSHVRVVPPAELRFYGLDLADNPSVVASETYRASNDRTPPVVQATPGGGVFTSAISVSLTANEPAQIYYTLDGTTPTSSSPRYTKPISLSGTTTLKFYGVDTSSNASSVQTAQYTFQSSGGGGGGGGGGGCFVGSLGAALPSLPLWLCGLALLLTLGAAPARAAGPFGGSVQDLVLAADGETPRWAATWRGLFSFEGGRWRRVEALGQRNLLRVVETGGRLVVAEESRGVWASDDGGATWVQESKGFAGPYGHAAFEVLSLRADPGRAGRLFAGTAGQGAFESGDAGKSWKLLRQGLEGQPPPAWHAKDLLPPAGDRPLLMGTDGAGLYAWTGGQWARWGEGLPAKLRVHALAAASDDPKHLALSSRGEGLWESRDAGKTWKLVRKGAYTIVGPVALGAGGQVAAYFAGEGLALGSGGKVTLLKAAVESEILALLPRAKGGWLAGLAHDGLTALSADGAPGGGLNEGLDATRVLSLAAGRAPGELWCGDTNGVFHSADGGATWQPRNGGLLPAAANVLVWQGARLLEGSNGQGVFAWNPEKGAWEDRSGGLGTSNTIYALALSADGKRLYVGTEGGVLRSDDEGVVWTHKNKGLPAGSLWYVAASPSGEGVWAAGGGGLFRSADAGESWEPAGEARAAGLAAELRGGQERVWVLEPQGLLARTDGALAPVPLALAPGERLVSLSAVGGEVWVGGTAGLWKVGGGDPVRVLEGPGALCVLPLAGGGGLVGTDGRGVVPLGPGGGGGGAR